MKHFRKCVPGMLLALALGAPLAGALAATTVTTSVSATASSGGNTVDSGEVTEGRSSVRVKVQTTINGHEIENFNQQSESSGAPVSIEYSKEFTDTAAGNATVEAGASANVPPSLSPSGEGGAALGATGANTQAAGDASLAGARANVSTLWSRLATLWSRLFGR